MDILGLLKDIARDMLDFAPNLLGALVLVIIGWIIAKLVYRATVGFLSRIRVDKLAERLNRIEIVDKVNFKLKPHRVIGKILYYFILLIFLIAATDVLGMPALTQLLQDIIDFIPQAVVALILLILGILLSDGISKMVKTACDSLGISSGKIIATVTFYFLFINMALLSLRQAGIQTGFLESNINIIIGGAVLAFAIGYGFASRNIASSLMSSFYSKDRFKLGDKIKVGDIEGEIIDMDKFTVTLSTKNGRTVFPLNKLVDEVVIFVEDN